MTNLLPPALCRRVPGTPSSFAACSCTVPVVTTPSVCSNMFRWKQKLMPFNPSPCCFLLIAHSSSTGKQPETSPVSLGAHILPFLLQHAGPWAQEGTLELASCSFHRVPPLRCWCTDKQEREPRPSTCLPPLLPSLSAASVHIHCCVKMLNTKGSSTVSHYSQF